MKISKLFLVSILLLSIVTIAAVNAAEDSNLTGATIDEKVSNLEIAQDSALADDIELNEKISTDNTQENKTFEDIEKLIYASHNGDTIELEGTYTGNGNYIFNEKSLTIIGVNEGATLDAGNLSYILRNLGNLTLKNINFINGNGSEYSGGAIYSQGHLTVTDCTFTSNYAYNGGAIHNEGTLIVNGCTFSKNNANLFGSAISSRGNVTIENSIFKDNNYEYSVLYVYNAFATINNITVASNKYTSVDYVSALNFERCNLTLINSKILNRLNSYQCNGSLSDCYFEDTFLNPDVNILNSTFKNCGMEYSKENGDLNGNIFDNSTINIISENVSIRNSAFKNLKIHAIYMNCHSADINNCKFENITQEAIKSIPSDRFKIDLNIINSTFENIFAIFHLNLYQPHPESKINFNNCKVNNSKRPIRLSADNVKITNCEFTNIKEKSIELKGNNQYVKNCSFENTDIGIFVEDYEETCLNNNFVIEDSNFKQCRYGISLYVNNLVVLNCNFISTQKSAVTNWGDSTNITNCSILNSKYNALDLIGKTYNGKNIIDNCNIINISNPPHNGYEVVVIGICNNTLINNSIFANNTSYDGTLAIHSQLTELVINNTQFINNTGLERAGAVFSIGPTKIINCLFKQNKAPIGSSICFEYIKDGTIIENTTFVDNVAENGRDVSGYCEMKVKQTGFYYGDTVVEIISYTDKMTNNPMSNAPLQIFINDMEKTMFNNQNEAKEIANTNHKTSKDGTATFKVYSLKVGTYRFYIYDEDSLIESKLQITVKKAPIKIVASKLTKAYDPNGYYTVKLLSSKTKKGIAYIKVTITVSGKKITATTDKNGNAKFSLSKFALGLNKLQISVSDSNVNSAKTTSTLKLNKAKTIITAPKLTAKYKKSAYFKVTVKTASKKLVKNTKVKVKIGSKTYNVKTNSKGVAQVNTKSLKIGTHKVSISSGDSRLTMSKKSTIVIKK